MIINLEFDFIEPAKVIIEDITEEDEEVLLMTLLSFFERHYKLVEHEENE